MIKKFARQAIILKQTCMIVVLVDNYRTKTVTSPVIATKMWQISY